MDAETNASTPLESYDRNGKFWKVAWIVSAPINFRGQHTLIEIASIAQVSGVDFQNSHITATVESPTTIDDDGAGTAAGPVPAAYRDVADVCVAKYNSGGGRGLKETVAVFSPAV